MIFGVRILSEPDYFRGQITLGGRLISGSDYFRGQTTFGARLLSGPDYFRAQITFGARLLEILQRELSFLVIQGGMVEARRTWRQMDRMWEKKKTHTHDDFLVCTALILPGPT